MLYGQLGKVRKKNVSDDRNGAPRAVGQLIGLLNWERGKEVSFFKLRREHVHVAENTHQCLALR